MLRVLCACVVYAVGAVHCTLHVLYVLFVLGPVCCVVCCVLRSVC